jgi:hypothetical protein
VLDGFHAALFVPAAAALVGVAALVRRRTPAAAETLELETAAQLLEEAA